MTQARYVCAFLLLGALIVGDASLLSTFSGPSEGWVVSPAAQKQWWGRWPGACGGVQCSAPPASQEQPGLRFPVDVWGDLLTTQGFSQSAADYYDDTGNCDTGLTLAMQQRFASYKFSCSGTPGTYIPDITNGPCPDMQLHMMNLQEQGACAAFTEGARTCNIVPGSGDRSNAFKVDCGPDGRLCSQDGGAGDELVCGTLQAPSAPSASNVCYVDYLGFDCGTAYLVFGERENSAAGNPPCDKDGSVEPGTGAGKNTGRCAIPCVTYRAYDESYWDAGTAFCPCLANHNMLPSTLLASPDARPPSRYFLYHTEFLMSDAEAPGKGTLEVN